MLRQLLTIAALLLAMGVLYLVVRWGAGHWNRFWGAQADKIDISPRDRDHDATGSTPEDPGPG
jgi:hypothetical protein